ncbi:hypothetical protein LH442_00225 [Laribacter hongkongensis]|uniref:hypothetical protein n=1 Tax=Laribacter hongkongensis TaxID=168471 RepID=UPI001EFE5809|nr:hypothetical protein [Laribacter hongkongensis]MCG9054427.1 hypothetical protein [Laribacter hongkongensis]
MKRADELLKGNAPDSLRFFAYDDEVGFERFNTEAEAKKSVQESIDEYRAIAAEGWPEEVENLCWGVVLGTTKEVPLADSEGNTTDLSGDRCVDYTLTNFQQSAPVNQQMLEALNAAKIGLRDWEIPENRYKAQYAVDAAIAAAEASGQENHQAEPVVPPRDILMRVAESVRAACFEACNENGGDWAAIHSLDLAEIIGELGSTEAAVQSQQVEPVAAQCKLSCESVWRPCSVEHHHHVLSCPDDWPGYETRLLYAAPQPSSPPSWKLVPVEPTMEMLNAGVDSGGIGLDYHEAIGRFIVAYSAMLAAAPEPEGCAE